MVNVYDVEGLKANLISISQLRDEWLKVVFTNTECQGIDTKGNVVLEGVPSNVCKSASQSQLDMWHKRMGHMNVNGLQRIVKANVVRGVPKLEESSGIVCKACCQGNTYTSQRDYIQTCVRIDTHGSYGSYSD